MVLDILKKRTKLNQSEQVEILKELAQIEKERQWNRTGILIITLLILLIALICFRLATIGFNSVETWEIDKIELTKENLKIANNTKINVFSGLNKIAPMSKGTYRFCVKNNSNYDMIYNIKFEHDMTNFINMRYRLKIDNIYIKGDSNTYVSIDELGLENIIVPKQSINIYTLEWCWEDDSNDIMIGTMKDEQYYYFRMQIISNIYEK